MAAILGVAVHDEAVLVAGVFACALDEEECACYAYHVIWRDTGAATGAAMGCCAAGVAHVLHSSSRVSFRKGGAGVAHDAVDGEVEVDGGGGGGGGAVIGQQAAGQVEEEEVRTMSTARSQAHSWIHWSYSSSKLQPIHQSSQAQPVECCLSLMMMQLAEVVEALWLTRQA